MCGSLTIFVAAQSLPYLVKLLSEIDVVLFYTTARSTCVTNVIQNPSFLGSKFI